MPTTVFLGLAVLMVLVAILLVALPLMRRGEPSPLAAGTIISLLPLSVALLYVTFSNWPWNTVVSDDAGVQAHNEQTASLAEMAVRLTQRLQSNPDDVEGWLMLGRTHVVLSRYPEAIEAYGTARELTNDREVNALTGYAESLAMMRGGVMDNEVAELFERALLLSPDDRKALWYGGLAAFEQGRAKQARDRWQRLLTLDPPEQMAAMLREQIAAANAALGITGPGNAATASESSISSPELPRNRTSVAKGLSLSVSMAPELVGQAGPNTPLFILARQPGVAGPPVAVVRRRVADLPLEIVLTDADSMIAGRVLSGFENVEVVARISMSGTPSAQAGDLSGSRTVASSGQASIVIDSVVGK